QPPASSSSPARIRSRGRQLFSSPPLLTGRILLAGCSLKRPTRSRAARVSPAGGGLDTARLLLRAIHRTTTSGCTLPRRIHAAARVPTLSEPACRGCLATLQPVVCLVP